MRVHTRAVNAGAHHEDKLYLQLGSQAAKRCDEDDLGDCSNQPAGSAGGLRGSIAHRMRAFLLASATTVFCQPSRSLSCCSHRLMRSLRLPALMTADFAPWISSLLRRRHAHQARSAGLIHPVHRKDILGEKNAREYDADDFPFRCWLMRVRTSHRGTWLPFCNAAGSWGRGSPLH